MQDSSRRGEGNETWFRLLQWAKGQPASERLAALILDSEGYRSIDPSHPLGGKDGGKDIICVKDGIKMIGAVYFPREQQTQKEIETKFLNDLKWIATNSASGMAFVTNQELHLAERKHLQDLAPNVVVDLFHLERIASILNTPRNYGVRQEFLDLAISQEEYIAFIADRDSQHYRRLEALETRLAAMAGRLDTQVTRIIGLATGADTVAYFRPSMYVNSTIISLTLLTNSAEYPAYDISGYWCDLDKSMKNVKSLGDATDRFFFPYLYPGKAISDALYFDIRETRRLRLNLFYSTRTRSMFQAIRAILEDNGRFHLANKIIVDTQNFETVVHPTFPGYDSTNPEAIFQ